MADSPAGDAVLHFVHRSDPFRIVTLSNHPSQSHGRRHERHDKDSTTRRLLEDILGDEQEHADELKDWLAN